ncbi:hypothetical protein [Alkalimarinus alittae]|uniref:Uncharacterized protein n=1 Tax=Alkalimarinus alittae TaxID=2961619 RepID=A0ABY6N1N9_9ALTE|nr:hypothetical protein [Alkalimarinus alittae]UZE95999.1 hypothetical protein NKI27_18440 [Alkalimarinus alittae]
MTHSNIINIKDKDAKKALNSLNRITGLNWESLPVSLVAGGLVFNASKQEDYTLNKKRA